MYRHGSTPLQARPSGEAVRIGETHIAEPALKGHVHRVNDVLVLDLRLRRRFGRDLDVRAVRKERRGLVLLERVLEPLPVLLITLLRYLLELVDARQTDPDAVGLHEDREGHVLVVLLDVRRVARLSLWLDIDLGNVHPDRRDQKEGGQAAHQIDERDDVELYVDALLSIASSDCCSHGSASSLGLKVARKNYAWGCICARCVVTRLTTKTATSLMSSLRVVVLPWRSEKPTSATSDVPMPNSVQ